MLRACADGLREEVALRDRVQMQFRVFRPETVTQASQPRILPS